MEVFTFFSLTTKVSGCQKSLMLWRESCLDTANRSSRQKCLEMGMMRVMFHLRNMTSVMSHLRNMMRVMSHLRYST